MLLLMTVGPLPPVFADGFSGTVTGSTANFITGKGTVQVTNAIVGETLTLYPENSSTSAQTKDNTTSEHTFNNVSPGKYQVTSKPAGGTESDRSLPVLVTPKAVELAEPSATRIVVSGAEPFAILTLHHDKSGFITRKTEADENGVGYFDLGYADEQVPPGKNYRAKQTINGVESAFSNSQDIAPRPVRLSVTIAGAGQNNNGGAIEVTDTRQGNRLLLYIVNSSNEPVIRNVEALNSYTFTGLSAGEYYVIQEENGAQSSRSNYAKIIDEMAPTISLVGPATDKVSMPKNYTNWEYPFSKSDVVAKDNISTPSIEITVSPNQKINTPGIYKITYTAKDDAGNTATVTKTVTIAPPTLDIDNVVHTAIPNENAPGRPTGDIWVNNVMGEATLKVYQDPGGKPIKTITRANDSATGLFEISGIPVGIAYYVTQVVNGIESETSPRVDIKDTTKPTIQLINKHEVEFIRGGIYIEYGATATDNIDNAASLSASIKIDSSAVNMSVPGKYIVTYNVTDTAGNVASTVIRTVYVKPHAVIAIGSTADLGEVGVTSAYPGATLKLYDVANPDKPIAVSKPLPVGVTTYVFKNPTGLDGTTLNVDMKIPPGSYYVIQEFPIDGEILESMRSNIVDVRDKNRPYITINGPENLSFIWNISINEYSYTANTDIGVGHFKDAGATADDYLDGPKLTNDIKKKILFGNKVLCNENIVTDPVTICNELIEMEFPGIYTIIYSVTTKRGAKADDKQRIITVAPPKIDKLKAEAGRSTIEVDGVLTHKEAVTVVNLYNAYGELINSQKPVSVSDPTAIFKDIPAGLGYYVTQTVNGIESAPSNPVNVSLFENASEPALITAFEFALERAYGVIDHTAGTIKVVVPKGTVVKSLKAKFATATATNIVKVGTEVQVSGITSKDFTSPVKYTVTPKDPKDPEQVKEYTVTVEIEDFETNAWTKTVRKSATFSAAGSTQTLSLEEKKLAEKQGVSFIGQDRAIHIPYGNAIEAKSPALTVKIPTIVTSSTDPVVNQPMEISWGNSAQPFVQPIEVEMKKQANKNFARLVRNNNQLVAIIQPSSPQGNDNIIGLATEPGTYALVENLAAPTITSATANTYRISAAAGGQIYYTTNSSHIAFDRSARDPDLQSYTVNNADLSNWTRYTGQPVAAPNGELYAIVMKGNIISPLAHVETIVMTEWKKTIERPAIKPVTITFNAKVDHKALYSGLIYIMDDSTNTLVATTLSLSADGKQISVVPDKSFRRGNQYTLYIDRQFKGSTKNNEFLKQPLTQTFIAK